MTGYVERTGARRRLHKGDDIEIGRRRSRSSAGGVADVGRPERSGRGGVVGWLNHGDLELPPDFAAEIRPTVVMPPAEDKRQFYAFPVDVAHDLDNLVGAASNAIREFLARLKPASKSPAELRTAKS